MPSNDSFVSTVRHGLTGSGRRIVICQCNGQRTHEHKPHGGGMMVFKCPPQPEYRDGK